MKYIKDIVKDVLERDYKSRANDEYLIAEVYRTMGLSLDLNEISKLGKKKVAFSTIIRWRRKWQVCYEHLRPSKEVQELREQQISKYQEIAKDSDMLISKPLHTEQVSLF